MPTNLVGLEVLTKDQTAVARLLVLEEDPVLTLHGWRRDDIATVIEHIEQPCRRRGRPRIVLRALEVVVIVVGPEVEDIVGQRSQAAVNPGPLDYELSAVADKISSGRGREAVSCIDARSQVIEEHVALGGTGVISLHVDIISRIHTEHPGLTVGEPFDPSGIERRGAAATTVGVEFNAALQHIAAVEAVDAVPSRAVVPSAVAAVLLRNRHIELRNDVVVRSLGVVLFESVGVDRATPVVGGTQGSRVRSSRSGHGLGRFHGLVENLSGFEFPVPAFGGTLSGSGPLGVSRRILSAV